ncbi:MAG: hypothetical protein F4X77_09795 [Acidobacteriia bacterium]|nr:hypothetical protein [Terriglobia bacterium]
MRESETRTKPGTSGGDETRKPRLEAEGLAAKLLWASKAKAGVVASVMNDECGPGMSGIADDFGVAVEMALKARLVFRECGPWNNPAGYRAMEMTIEKRLGHNADGILRALPPEDVEAVKKLYDDCVDEHRHVHLSPGPSRNAEFQWIGDGRLLEYQEICGPHVAWADFDEFIGWVGRAVRERYHPDPPRISLPVGGAVRPDPRGAYVQIPSFADRLIEWVREPMDELWSKRTLKEELKTNRNIAAARAGEPATAVQESGKNISIPLGPGDASTLRAAANASGASFNDWVRRVLLDAARRAGQSA